MSHLIKNIITIEHNLKQNLHIFRKWKVKFDEKKNVRAFILIISKIFLIS